ncbi:Methylated-DNA--protein-cysteine methyltransferase [Clostridiaceae bacterium JG1575]|nr:Methylated-DNA--protein-cysteine methyltransferase [Clostridiaceae bacterium JG1575]
MDECTITTPLGPLRLRSDGQALVEATFLTEPGIPSPPQTPLLAQAAQELWEYFSAVRQKFDVPLSPSGSPFQQMVWAALRQIPYGECASYQEVAQAIGHPLAYRAVGSANGRNPLPLFIPCHRVIAADGRLGGYSAGLERKKALLHLEGATPPGKHPW